MPNGGHPLSYRVYVPYQAPPGRHSTTAFVQVTQFFNIALDPQNKGMGPCPMVDWEGQQDWRGTPVGEWDVIEIGTSSTDMLRQTAGSGMDPDLNQVALVVAAPTASPPQLLLVYSDTANLPVLLARQPGPLDALKAPRNSLLGVLFYAGRPGSTDFVNALGAVAGSIGGGTGVSVIGMAGIDEKVAIAPNGTFGTYGMKQ